MGHRDRDNPTLATGNFTRDPTGREKRDRTAGACRWPAGMANRSLCASRRDRCTDIHRPFIEYVDISECEHRNIGH